MFISFEGIDGSGKSTQARLLAEALRSAGHDVLEVREPGGTEIGETIRSMLLDPSADITPRAELLLFSAARAQLVETTIRPALNRGAIVIADRFFDSTTAYQGGGRQLATAEALSPLHAFATGGLAPDRTYLLALSPAEAHSRAEHRDRLDRMERAGPDFYARIASAYSKLAAEQPDRVYRVDADQTVGAIHASILIDVRDRIETST